MKLHHRVVCMPKLLITLLPALNIALGWPVQILRPHFKSIPSSNPRHALASPSISSGSSVQIPSGYLEDRNNNAARRTFLTAVASQVDIQERERDRKTVKILKEIAFVGIPALGGVLIDPLMSLIDSACVGQISTLQLAALAPCTSIYQFCFFMFYFLPATTTNLVASNSFEYEGLSEKEVDKREEENQKVVSCAVLLAVVCGCVATSILLKFSDQLLSLAGCSSLSMMLHARRYLCIRSLAFPFVLVATVLQGASLGHQDSLTPLKIFGLAGLFNLIGDVVLTLQFGWGTTGAAVATLASQIFAGTYFVCRSIRKKEKGVGKTAVQLTWKGLPSKELLKSFAKMASSLILRSITAMSAYSLMTKVASTMGSLSLAAHQVTLQVWWLLSLLTEPTVAAAQSLVARDMKSKTWRVSKLVRILYCTTLLTGCSIAIVTGILLSIPWCTSFIVADASVQSILCSVAMPAATSQVACALSYLCDSISVACGEIWYLPLHSTIALLHLIMALQIVKQRSAGLVGVWMASASYFICRLVGHLIFSKQIRRLLFDFESQGFGIEFVDASSKII